MASRGVWVKDEAAARLRLGDLLSRVEFAVAAGINESTLDSYRTRGRVPEPVAVVGGTPLWSRAQVKAWLAGRPGMGWRRGKTSKQQPPARKAARKAPAKKAAAKRVARPVPKPSAKMSTKRRVAPGR